MWNRISTPIMGAAKVFLLIALIVCRLPSEAFAGAATHAFPYGVFDIYDPPIYDMLNFGNFDSLGYNRIQARFSDNRGWDLDFQQLIDSGYRVLSLTDSSGYIGGFYHGGDSLPELKLLRHGLHILLEAEDTVTYGNQPDRVWRTSHDSSGAAGVGRLSVDGASWVADPAVDPSPGYMWDGPLNVQPNRDELWVKVRMKVDNNSGSDIVAILSFKNGNVLLRKDTVRANEFTSSDSWQSFDLYKNAAWQPQTNSGAVHVLVYWPRTRKLSVDWVQIFDERARDVMANSGSVTDSAGNFVEFKGGDTTKLHLVKAFLSKYDAADSLGAFLKVQAFEEGGLWDLERIGMFRFADSLFRTVIPGMTIESEFALFNISEPWGAQGLSYYARNGTFDGSPVTVWPYFTMLSHVHCRDTSGPVWFNTHCDSCQTGECSGPIGGIVPPDSLDGILALLNDIPHQLKTLRSYPSGDSVKVHFFETIDPAWSNLYRNGDGSVFRDTTRYTPRELQAMTFLPIAYGVAGIYHYVYLGGSGSFGMDGMIDITTGMKYDRYYTIRDSIRPVMDAIGPILATTTWVGGDFLDSVVWAGNTYVTGYTSDKSPAHLDIGFFENLGSSSQYFMLVNKRTADTAAQHVTIVIDKTDLNTQSDMYYVIDVVKADTLLAGALNNEIEYTTDISPGGAKFIKIMPGPNRITGGSYPAKWWGAIHADEMLDVGLGNTLTLQSPLHLYMHSVCGSDPIDGPVEFWAIGKLVARGTPTSPIVFDYILDGPGGPGCSGADSLHWGGLYFGGLSACTLQYCEIRKAVYGVHQSWQGSLVLDHVTMIDGRDTALLLQPQAGAGETSLLNSRFDGKVVIHGGKVRMDYCNIDSIPIGIEIHPAAPWNDSAVIKHTRMIGVDSIGILIDGYPARLQACTLYSADVGVHVKSGTLHLDTLKTFYGGQGILLDTNATIAATVFRSSQTAIPLYVRQGWGWLSDCSIDGADTGMVADPGSGHTLQCTHFNVSQSKKGIVARSGTLQLDSSGISADSLTGIDAYGGSTILRLNATGVSGAATAGAAISVGPDSRLVASNSFFDHSWIGVELRRNGSDTISNCNLSSNTLYGIWCDSGTTTDYLSGNYIVNDTASALNFGINVLLQPIHSVDDTIMGGYNWNFNFNSGHRADVYFLVARGKPGDDWGLVFNGPLAQNDSAFARGVDVRKRYDGAHLYLRYLYASVKESHFVSGDTGYVLASPYGIKDMGSTTGLVRCTEVAKMRTDLVYVSYGSSINWGTAADNGKNNIFAPISSAKLFRNLGSTTTTAEYNWWGNDPPDSTRFVGLVDRSPWLTDSTECESNPDAKIASTVVPLTFALEQNYPNPFNPLTTIQFSIPLEQDVKLDIFNVLGQRVRAFNLGTTPAGYHEVIWDGRSEGGVGTGSGMYFYRLSTPKFTNTKKMLLLK